MVQTGVGFVENLIKTELKKEGFGVFLVPDILGLHPDFYILFKKINFFADLEPSVKRWLAQIYVSDGACYICWNSITNPIVDQGVITILVKIANQLRSMHKIKVTIKVPS